MLATIGFLLTISILVVVHEFGHYIFARIFGVKVLSFSIGFGPKLLSWHSKNNEWRIGLIPLGGYVKMLDEREAPVSDALKPQAFNNKKPLQKLLIAFAGPLFNIIFAFCAYYGLGIYGVYTLKPVIQSVNLTPLIKTSAIIPESSTIIKINDNFVSSWNNADDLFTDEAKSNNNINLELKHESKTQEVNLDLTTFKNNRDDASLQGIGLYPFKYLPIIAYTEPQSAATLAGIREGDKILMVNKTPIKNWFQLTEIIRNNPSNKLDFLVQRGDKRLDLIVIPNSTYNDDGQIIGKIGIMPTLDVDSLMQNSYIKKYSLISSFSYASNACIDNMYSNLYMLTMIAKNKVSWHNLGGPVSIAKASEGAIHQGVKAFIDLLALISLSIALMNLLPIPVLDGGHILIYGIEWLIGKPIDNRIQNILFTIGLFIVLSLTGLALYNDFLKLLNW